MTLAPKTVAAARRRRQRVLIVGCGYLGGHVARRAAGRGDAVWAMTRRRDRAEALAAEGLRPLVADWTDARSLRRLPDVDRVLVAVSYDRSSGLSRHTVQVGGLGRLLEALHGEPDICYISTTGVYPQTDGRWVDEASPARPSRDAARVHLEAENLLWRRRPKSPGTILRLGGLYGPGRLPRADELIAGRPIRSHPHSYLNLIHLEDAARAVEAAWRWSRRRLYLVADDQPVRRDAFYRHLARLLGTAPPRFEPPEPFSAASVDPRDAGRSTTNKRVWNRRMKRDLMPGLTMPTYRDGLAEVAEQLKRSRGTGSLPVTRSS